MKGFVAEFNEHSETMNSQINELEAQLSEKNKTIEELKEELNRKDEENKKAISDLSDENQVLKTHLNETALALAEFYEATMANNA
nr:MAG TPA: docking domain containing protein [Caudoviricetes sp.]